MNHSFRTFGQAGFRLAVVLSMFIVGSALSHTWARSAAAAGTIEVSASTQLTTGAAYDRNPSFLQTADGTYWLFFTRSNVQPCVRPTCNPDQQTYDVFYMTSADGLDWSEPTQLSDRTGITGTFYGRTVAATQAADGTLWLFWASGGNGHQLFYYTYSGGVWSARAEFPDQYYFNVEAVSTADGDVWVFYEDCCGPTPGIYSLVYDADTGWAAPSLVAAGLSIPKAIVDGSNFHIVMVSGLTGEDFITSSTDGGSTWSTPASVAAPSGSVTNWDPTIFMDAGGNYNLFNAPDLGTGVQQIAWKQSADGIDWSAASAPVTAGGYGSATWWDYWPEAATIGSDTYLFYTSENNGTTLGNGHIWMTKVDWTPGTPHYEAIEPAITVALDGDTINVAPGTYAGALQLSQDNLSLIGAGSALVTIDVSVGTSAVNQAAVNITGSGVTLQGVTVNGSDTNTNGRYGIRVNQFPVPVTLTDVRVQNMFRTGIDLNGTQNAVLTDVQAIDNGGAGLSLSDVKGATLTNITTSGNPWGGVGIFNWGRFYPIGNEDIIFAGTNSFGESGDKNGGLYLESANWNDKDNPDVVTWSTNPADNADVTLLGADFGYVLQGDHELQQYDGTPYGNDTDYTYNYERFYNTQAQALAAAVGTPDHFLPAGRFVQDVPALNFFVGPGMSIQTAIDAASAGDTVNVTAGTYAEAVNVNKVITLQGAGSGDNPAVDTILSSSGTGLNLSAGADASNRVIVKNMRVTGYTTGIVASSFNTLDNIASTGNFTYGISLNNLQNLIITGSEFNGNDVGLKIASTAGVDDVTITDSAFDGNNLGWYSDKANGSTSNITNLSVSNTSFSDNVNKGFYTEKLSDAVFDNVTVDNNGTGGATNHRAGFDLNLKYGNYANIQILNSTFSNNGTGDGNGGGLLIKARSTGSYAANPATLAGVTLTNLVVTGNGGGTYGAGIRIGESNNSFTGIDAGPTGVVVSGSSFSGNGAHGLRNATAATTVTAESNYWGAASGPGDVGPGTGDAVSTGVDFSPWCTDAACTTFASVDADGDVIVPPGATAAEIQAIIDDAPAGSTVVLPGEAISVPGGFFVNTAGLTIVLSPGTVILPSSPCFTITADDATILADPVGSSSCTPSSGSHGIDVTAAVSNLTIQGLEFIGTNGTDAIHLGANVDGLKIIDNYIHGFAGDGIEYAAGTTVSGVHRVQGNLFLGNGLAINNASGNAYNVEYNAFGTLAAPVVAGPNGISADLDADPHTHAALSAVSSGSPEADKVAVGAQITYTIQIAAAELYAADFDLDFDETLLEVVSLTNSGTFASAPGCALDSVANANSSGSISFCGQSLSAVNGAAINVFTVVFEGLSAGATTLDFDAADDIFAMNPPSGDSNNVFAGALNDQNLEVFGLFNVTGTIDLQGRANDSGALLTFQVGSLQGYGPFAFSASTNFGAISASSVVADTYNITVSMARYLDVTLASNKSFSVSSVTTALSTLTLLGGDANDNDVIDIADASIIGGQYGNSGAGITLPGADINNDGTVNIFDLVLVGGNLDKTPADYTWVP